jgi:flagellar hook assembly protein FlgD
MQNRQQSTARARKQRGLNGEISPGTLITALSIGTVVLIVAVTFFSDWFQAPQLSISGTGQYLSPNSDGNNDSYVVTYHLDDDFKVTARVLSGQNIIRTLIDNQPKTVGDNFVSWDGRNDLGTVASDGVYTIEVAANGSMRSTSQRVQVQVDTQPPMIQLANMPDALRVSKPDMVIEGVTEPGAIVLLNGASQPMRVDSSGRFKIPFTLTDGNNSIDIKAIDPAGNTTRITRTISLVTQAPEIVLTRPLENEWTNNQLLTVDGRTLPNTTLTINQQQVRVEPDGHFQYQTVLNEGDNSLHLVATNDVGITTTVDRIVHLKTGALPIQVNLQDGATVADSNLPIIGKVDAGSTVSINGRLIPVSALGDFQVTAPLLQGDNIIEIEARDPAGNITKLVRRVNYSSEGTDEFTRLSRNLEQLPVLLVPSMLVVAAILAFIYLRQNRVSLTLSVDQPTFIPGLPGDDKALAISLDLSKTANVSLEVLDQKGYPRATILRNRRKIGRKHIFYWNGYDDHGRPLPPDEYTVQVEAGAPPLQVSSALQIRIERNTLGQTQSPAYTQRKAVNTTRQDR